MKTIAMLTFDFEKSSRVEIFCVFFCCGKVGNFVFIDVRYIPIKLVKYIILIFTYSFLPLLI